MSAKTRRKEICGVVLTSSDGSTWSWQVGPRSYQWTPLGLLLRTSAKEEQKQVFTSKGVEAAVGYSVGYQYGWQERQLEIDPTVK